MGTKEDEFLKRIRATFRMEAEEHLDAFSAGLIDLEKTQSQDRHAGIIETLFREIHSLKGAARSIDQKEVESICQPLESVLSALKRQEIHLSPSSFDLFYKIIGRLKNLIFESGSEPSVSDLKFQRELIRQLKEMGTAELNTGRIEGATHNTKAEPIAPKPDPITENQAGPDTSKGTKPVSVTTVRIPVSKLDPLLLQAEELIMAKKSINQRIDELQEINAGITGWKTELLQSKGDRSIAASPAWNEWSESNAANLNKLEGQLETLTRSLDRDKYSLDNMVDIHLEAMRQLLLLPVSSMTEVFPGMIREISREQKKEIEFILRGAELEIDKRILEELKDPLIHLLRNSIDHGIDQPQERISRKKPPHGTITLDFAARDSGMVDITLSDDGNGINKENVLKAAIQSGFISREEAEKMDPDEILPLIFQSGVSTSSIITAISGRGLGLSIVREKTEKLNGSISVETEAGAGTSFHLLLPMALATFRGILVETAQCQFILPTTNVERVMIVAPEEIKTVENHETIRIDDQVLPVADLGEVLGLPEFNHSDSAKPEPGVGNPNQIRMVVLVSGEHRMAFRVDEVVDEQQVLVKGLGKLLSRVRNISGATVLGSGKVVPVLHSADLIKSAFISAEKTKARSTWEHTVEKTKKILVADDSITSRTLIKNILETAGYSVTTAVDGKDAFTRARTHEFDLIVSDVDMPRMNGFELIVKIRHDQKLSEVPVVLVTSLGSPEDREHGIEVGADAYIIKSSFDQNNLLETVRRLI